MDLDRLIDEEIGRERYEEACRWAWRIAAGPPDGAEPDAEDMRAAQAQIDAMSEAEWARLSSLARTLYLERARGVVAEPEWPEDLFGVPQDVADLIWSEPGAPEDDQVPLTLAALRAMPAYGILFVPWLQRDDLTAAQLAALLKGYREILEAPEDELAAPVTYSLFVDWFAMHDRAMWDAVTVIEGDYERRIQRVLGVSGPVPWAWKDALYAQLRDSQRWHPHIFDSLVDSVTALYGDVDGKAGLRWLSRLALPRTMKPAADDLAAALRSRR